MKITNILRNHVHEALTSFELGEIEKENISLEHPADKSHGDYSTNIAMVLFGQIKQDGTDVVSSNGNDGSDDIDKLKFNSPRELAQAIVDHLQNGVSGRQLNSQSGNELSGQFTNQPNNFSENISKIEVAGPGFINFTLSDAFLLSKMGLVIEKGGDVIEKTGSGKKVMIEFTDPNPFKELHIGHLYSNIVGEAIAKSYEAQGSDVKRACYQGDVGMHVSKSVWGMKNLFADKYPGETIEEALAKLELEPLNKKVSFLGKSYATGATAYKDDESAKEEIKDINYFVFISAQENLQDLTGFEPQVDYQKFVPDFSQNSKEYEDVKKLYVSGRKWSLEYFDSMYSRVGMSFDEFFFESLVGEIGYQIVDEFLKKGVFEKSDGAVIFPGSKYGLHDRVFINSLGLPTYETKELGLAPEKFRRYEYDKSIIITGNEIDEYFKVLLKALEFTNPDLRSKTNHLSHGMVRLPEGKMSSRTGKVITAEWLMDEANKRIREHMLKTRPEFTDEEINNVSELVGLGAIKFAFLKQSIGKDMAFSFEESLNFSGNSGPYIQYTYVRCHSMLTKAQNTVFNDLKPKKNVVENGNKSVEKEVDDSVVDGGNGEENRVDTERAITKYFDILLNNKAYFEHQLNESEKDVLRNLYRYSDIVKSAAEDYAPHNIAGYLYELAQSFNAFYGQHKVVDEVNDKKITEFRLMLVQAVALVLKHGLQILGIEVVEKM